MEQIEPVPSEAVHRSEKITQLSSSTRIGERVPMRASVLDLKANPTGLIKTTAEGKGAECSPHRTSVDL